MKLWEALEQSNKVRRKGWTPKYHYKIVDNRAFSLCNDDMYKMFLVFPCSDFLADDWEPYKEPEPEAGPEIDPLQIFKNMVSSDGNTVFGAIIKIFEQQQKQICRLEKAQIEHEREIGKLKLIAHDHGVHGIEKPVVR